MSFGADDLTPLLTPPPSQQVRFGQATILEWDPETFQNRVAWRGVTFRDLPVLAGAEALSFQEGDTVALLGWGTTAAAGSWWILGRVVIPGTDKGNQAVAWMTSQIGRRLALAVFGEAIHAIQKFNSIIVESSDWGDPSLGPAGPEITEVEISDSGRCLIAISARFRALIVATDMQGEAQMSVDISGATNRAPGNTGILAMGRAGPGSDVPIGEVTRIHVVEDLNAGLHTFRAQYQLVDAATSVNIQSPGLVVIPF